MGGLLVHVGSEVVMAEKTTEQLLTIQEWNNHGTTWTRNKEFDKNGYYVVKDLWDVKELYHSLPPERGQLNYWGKRLDQFEHEPVEGQVEGSVSRYNHPQYRRVHIGIGHKIAEIIGRKLYPTYFYDRYYFPGQELTRHADRDACEISVTVHVSTNIKEDWPIWIKTPDVYTDKTKKHLKTKGKNRSVVLNAGDGMIYKGCERPHWRDRMPGSLDAALSIYNKELNEELYYHQIFFHYVLQDGQRAHCAWDRAK